MTLLLNNLYYDPSRDLTSKISKIDQEGVFSAQAFGKIHRFNVDVVARRLQEMMRFERCETKPRVVKPSCERLNAKAFRSLFEEVNPGSHNPSALSNIQPFIITPYNPLFSKY